MLFICKHCKKGHSVLNVECFYSNKKKKFIYLCKEHLSTRTADMMHQPWSSSYTGGCKVCDDTNGKCAGFQQEGIIAHRTTNNFCIAKKINT